MQFAAQAIRNIHNMTTVPVRIHHVPFVVVLVRQQHHIRPRLQQHRRWHLLPLATLLAPAAIREHERCAGEAVEGHPVVAVHGVVFGDDGGAVVVDVQCRMPFKAGLGQQLRGTTAIAGSRQIQRVEERASTLPPHLRQPRRRGAVEAPPLVGLEGPPSAHRRQLGEVADQHQPQRRRGGRGEERVGLHRSADHNRQLVPVHHRHLVDHQPAVVLADVAQAADQGAGEVGVAEGGGVEELEGGVQRDRAEVDGRDAGRRAQEAPRGIADDAFADGVGLAAASDATEEFAGHRGVGRRVRRRYFPLYRLGSIPTPRRHSFAIT